MRPNIEEIQERMDNCLSAAFFTSEDVRDIVNNVPELLGYIHFLENIPLVEAFVKQHEEIIRLREALHSIATGHHEDDAWNFARITLDGDTK